MRVDEVDGLRMKAGIVRVDAIAVVGAVVPFLNVDGVLGGLPGLLDDGGELNWEVWEVFGVGDEDGEGDDEEEEAMHRVR